MYFLGGIGTLISSEIIKWIPKFNISYQGLLIVAVIFSWVGIRQIAGFIWAGIFILSISRLAAIDNTMGVLGSIYILSAFISGIIQWQVLDIHLSLKEIKTEFLAPVANTVLEDVSSAGKTLPNIVNDVSSVAGKVGGVAKQGVQSAVKHAENHIENKKKELDSMEFVGHSEWVEVLFTGDKVLKNVKILKEGKSDE